MHDPRNNLKYSFSDDNHVKQLKEAFSTVVSRSSDVSIISEDKQQIHSNRRFLGIFSPSLRDILGNIPDHVYPTIILPDCSSSSINNCLKIITGNSIQFENVENWSSMVKTANVLGIKIRSESLVNSSIKAEPMEYDDSNGNVADQTDVNSETQLKESSNDKAVDLNQDNSILSETNLDSGINSFLELSSDNRIVSSTPKQIQPFSRSDLSEETIYNIDNENDRDANNMSLQTDAIKQETFNFDDISPKELITKQADHKICQITNCAKTITPHGKLRDHYVNHFWDDIVNKYGKFVDNVTCVLCSRVFSTRQSALKHVAIWHSKINEILTSKNYFPLPLQINIKDQPLNDDLEANVSNEELPLKSLGGVRPGIERHDDKTKPVEAKHNFNQQNEVTDKSVSGGTSVNHNPITNLKEPMTILYDNLQSGENGDSSQVKEEPWEPLEADVEHERSQINDIPSNAMEREEIKKELFDFDRNVIPKEMITEQSVHKLCQVCLKSETDMSNLRNHYTTHFMKEINERYGKFVDDKSCTYCTPPKLLSSHNAVLRHIATWHSKVNSILTSKNLLPLPLTLNVKDTERETAQERTGPGQPIPSSSALGFACQLCNQNLKSFSALRYHFYTKHFKIEVNAQFGHLADEETGLTCLLCKNKQSSKQGTMNHIAIIHSKVNEVIAEKGMGYLLTGNPMVEGKVFSDVLSGGKDPNEALVGGKATSETLVGRKALSETLTEGKTPSESLDGGKTAIETMVPRKAPSETLAGGKAPIETLAGGKIPSKGLDGVKAPSETFIGGKAPTETTFDNTPGTPVSEKIPEQQNITKTEKSSEAMAKKQLIQRLISTPHNEMYQPNKEATEPTKEKNTSEVSDILLEEFKKDPFLTKERTKLISEKVNMTESIVWKWFYSARKRKSEDNRASNDSTIKPKATKEILTSDKELANSKNKQISYFSESKEMKLKKEFFVSKHLNKERTQKIAAEVKLSEEQVEKWFAERIKLISQNKPPFTIDKLKRLNYEFCQSQNLSRERSKSLALQLGLNEKQIVQWFTTKIRSHNNRPGMDKESNLSVNKTSDVPQTYINKNRVEPQTSVNKNTGNPQTSGDKNTASPQTPFNKTGDVTQMSSVNKTNVVPETSANKTNMTPQTFVNKTNASPQTFVNKTNGAPQTNTAPPTSNSKSTLWPQSSAFKPNRSLKSFINKTNVPHQISINKISMKQKYFNKTSVTPQNSESKTNIMPNIDLTKSGGIDLTKTGGMSQIDVPKTSVIPEALVSKPQLIVSKTNVTPQPSSNKTFQSSVNNNFVKAQFTGNKTNAIPQSSVNKPNGMSMSSVISNAMSQFSVNKPNGIPPSSVNKSNAIPPSSVNKTNATPQSSFNKTNGMPQSSVNKTNSMSSDNKSNAMPQSSVNKTNNVIKTNEEVPSSASKPNMTINQLLRLEKEFNLNQLKTKEIRSYLASEINVTEKDVDQWLQQRNMVKQKFAGGTDSSKTITAVKNAETKQVQNKRIAETESNNEVKRSKMEEAIVGKVIKMENNLNGSNIDNYEHQSKKAAYSCGCGESFLSDEAFAIHKSYTCKNLTVGTIPQRS